MNETEASMPEEPAEPAEAPADEAPPRKPPALTITIQSWATPIVGLAMLILGAVGGFFLRPLIQPGDDPASPAAQVEAPAVTAAANPNAAQMMQLVTEQTRHFAGSENAKVTIIEFSDYQ
jgi:protein-disulfide isomerase